MKTPRPLPWHTVRDSSIHGKGVFAKRDIPAGTRIFEYEGERISAEEADERHPVDPDNPFHTFFFSIESGMVIDGGVGGNDSRWINHSCAPNCDAEETDDGRIFIINTQPLSKGEELLYDYGLVIDARYTAKLKKSYACLCGSPDCRGTMLAPKKRKRASSKT